MSRECAVLVDVILASDKNGHSYLIPRIYNFTEFCECPFSDSNGVCMDHGNGSAGTCSNYDGEYDCKVICVSEKMGKYPLVKPTHHG